MLKELDYTAIQWDTNNPTEKKIAEAIESALSKYGKITTKKKIITKGTFIVIYAYDKSLYRNVIVDTIQMA